MKLALEVRNIIVMMHAIERVRARHAPCRNMTNQEITDLVRDRVVAAAADGGAHEQKTKAFRASGESKATLPPGQRFIQDNELGYVVDIGRLPIVTVVTIYTRLPRIPVPDRPKRHR